MNIDRTIDYFVVLSNGIPALIIEISFLLMICAIIFVFALFDNIRKVRTYVILIILLEYLFFIVCTTILYRNTLDTGHIDMTPFWSYSILLQGKDEGDAIFKDIIQNILMMVPVGSLLLFSRTLKNGSISHSLD